MSSPYKYDSGKNNSNKPSSNCNTYSSLKMSDYYTCENSCLCPANINERSTFDQYMYNTWILYVNEKKATKPIFNK
jgi:hypothetical protein